MTVIRVEHRHNYAVISKGFLEDDRLSFKAKGILTYLLSRPDNWTVKGDHLATLSTDGRKAVFAALGELEAFGYLERSILRDEHGHFKYESIVRESPIDPFGNSDKGNSDKGNSDKGNSEKGQSLISNEGVSIDPVNNELTNNDQKLPIRFQGNQAREQRQQGEQFASQSEESGLTEQFTEPVEIYSLAVVPDQDLPKSCAKKVSAIEALAEQFKDLYNANKPDAWAKCEKLNKKRVAAFKRLLGEEGQGTAQLALDALKFAGNDREFWDGRKRDSKFDLDTLLANGQCRRLAEKYRAGGGKSKSQKIYESLSFLDDLDSDF